MSMSGGLEKGGAMKKVILVGLGIASACFPAGSREINKTFIKASEPVAMMLKDRLLPSRSRDDLNQKGLVSVDVTTFYRSSIEPKKLGQALGYNGMNEINVSASSGAPIDPVEFFYKHSDNPTDLTDRPDVGGSVRLEPTERVWGAVFQVHRQCSQNWFVGLQLPFVRIRRDLGREIIAETTDSALNASLERYLDGNFEQNSGVAVQEKLKFAKIPGTAQSTYGLSDCTFYAGKQLVDDDDAKMSAWAEVLVSSKDRGTGEYLFEPVLGNGGFHALGAGLAGQITLEEDFARLSGVRFYAKGRIFEQDDQQIRTLGLRLNGTPFGDTVYNEEGSGDVSELDPYHNRAWGHMILGGQTGKAGFFPLANRLTKQIEVRPGPQLDIGTSFFSQSKSVDVHIGYGMTLQQAEELSWKTPFFGDDEIGYNAKGMQYYAGNVAMFRNADGQLPPAIPNPHAYWDIDPDLDRGIDDTIESQPRQVLPELSSCQVPHSISHQIFVQANFYLFDQNKQFFGSWTYQWSENRMMASAWECSFGLKIELF